MALGKTTRRLMFVAAVIIFGISAYVAILYAQGYQFSFSESRFVRTGAITVDATAQADVFIDAEHAGGTFLIGDTFSKGRLLPGTYELRMERKGYSTWSKSVLVQEGLVTDFPRVLIMPVDEENASRSRGFIDDALTAVFLPATPTPRPPAGAAPSPSLSPSPTRYALARGVLTVDDEQLTTGVLGYQESPDGAKLLWYTRNEVGVLWLKDSGEQPFRITGEMQTVARLTTRIDGAAWWPDSHHVAVKSSGTYQVIELDDRGGTNTIRF